MSKIFFAIPCGDFYYFESKIIDDICNKHNIEKVVIEEKCKTGYLWKQIKDEIESSDKFICDISSRSPNIIIELGYALKAKKQEDIAIFISKNIEVFSDIRGIKYMQYGTYSEFKQLLEKWINESIDVNPLQHKEETVLNNLNFHDDFKDFNKFIRLWYTPPGCQYNLEFDGLHITDCHMPIMSTHLSLLQNHSFEFKAKIISGAVGWVIKGTKSYNDITPQFCLMFNITREGILTPHIFNRNHIDTHNHYHVLSELNENIGKKIDPTMFHDIKTCVDGDLVEVYFDGKKVFSHTFGIKPFESNIYSFNPKGGQVGFRCHPSEEAIIQNVKIAVRNDGGRS